MTTLRSRLGRMMSSASKKAVTRGSFRQLRLSGRLRTMRATPAPWSSSRTSSGHSLTTPQASDICGTSDSGIDWTEGVSHFGRSRVSRFAWTESLGPPWSPQLLRPRHDTTFGAARAMAQAQRHSAIETMGGARPHEHEPEHRGAGADDDAQRGELRHLAVVPQVEDDDRNDAVVRPREQDGDRQIPDRVHEDINPGGDDGGRGERQYDAAQHGRMAGAGHVGTVLEIAVDRQHAGVTEAHAV